MKRLLLSVLSDTLKKYNPLALENVFSYCGEVTVIIIITCKDSGGCVVVLCGCVVRGEALEVEDVLIVMSNVTFSVVFEFAIIWQPTTSYSVIVT